MLIWDKIDERIYESGLDRGVLYPAVGPGVVWNGLQGISEKSSNGEVIPLYLDGQLYYNYYTTREHTMSIKALSYPKEFDECLGSVSVSGVLLTNQISQPFAMAYRTKINADHYKIHVIYNCLVQPDSVVQSTVDQAIKPNSYSWNVVTTPPDSPGRRPTAHIAFDTREISESDLQAIEDILYGKTAVAPALPTQTFLYNLLTPV